MFTFQRLAEYDMDDPNREPTPTEWEEVQALVTAAGARVIRLDGAIRRTRGMELVWVRDVAMPRETWVAVTTRGLVLRAALLPSREPSRTEIRRTAGKYGLHVAGVERFEARSAHLWVAMATATELLHR